MDIPITDNYDDGYDAAIRKIMKWLEDNRSLYGVYGHEWTIDINEFRKEFLDNE